jgi:transcription elongation GreA/GreB family factor
MEHLRFYYYFMPTYKGLDSITRLDNKFRRAIVVKDGYIPDDIIMINSQFTLSEIESEAETSFILTLPEPADSSENKVSVFSPFGCAVIGGQIGDIIEYEMPVGTQKYVVQKIDNYTQKSAAHTGLQKAM